MKVQHKCAYLRDQLVHSFYFLNLLDFVFVISDVFTMLQQLNVIFIKISLDRFVVRHATLTFMK